MLKVGECWSSGTSRSRSPLPPVMNILRMNILQLRFLCHPSSIIHYDLCRRARPWWCGAVVVSNMSQILPIEEESVRRIVAGQAVTDLSSAVKELVDNALDANAKSINSEFAMLGCVHI